MVECHLVMCMSVNGIIITTIVTKEFVLVFGFGGSGRG